MTHRKGTFKPASARSKKAAGAAEQEALALFSSRFWYCSSCGLPVNPGLNMEGCPGHDWSNGKSTACLEGRHESTDPDSCVWCRCSCHYLKPLEYAQ